VSASPAGAGIPSSNRDDAVTFIRAWLSMEGMEHLGRVRQITHDCMSKVSTGGDMHPRRNDVCSIHMMHHSVLLFCSSSRRVPQSCVIQPPGVVLALKAVMHAMMLPGAGLLCTVTACTLDALLAFRS
jgi:hypothetical protein